jgi:hypothetical protein
MDKSIDDIIKENFHKFVTPTLLTFAESIAHPYDLHSFSLEYDNIREVFTITVVGINLYGKQVTTKEFK